MLQRPQSPEPITWFLAVLALTLAFSNYVHADPLNNVHLKSEATCSTKTTSFVLPPGFFFDESKFAALDAEVHRLQDAETRLNAENISLKQSASKAPTWWSIVIPAVAAAVTLAIDRL